MTVFITLIHIYLDSAVLRDLILFIIPDYIPPLPIHLTPLCGNGMVNIVISRNTTNHASSESFNIRDSTGRLIFTQPPVEDNHQYTWNVVTQLNYGFAIRLTDSSKKGWSEGSVVSISGSSFFYGTFTLSQAYRSIQSFYSIPTLQVTEDNNDCEKISLNCWGSITLASSRCNSLSIPLNISNYPYLQSISFGRNSLEEITSLTISNDPHLETINIEDNSSRGSLEKATSFYVESIIIIYSN